MKISIITVFKGNDRKCRFKELGLNIAFIGKHIHSYKKREDIS